MMPVSVLRRASFCAIVPLNESQIPSKLTKVPNQSDRNVAFDDGATMFKLLLSLGIGVALATLSGCRNCAGERFRLFDRRSDDCGTCLTSRSKQPAPCQLTSAQPINYPSSSPIDFATGSSYSGEPVYPIGSPIILDRPLPSTGNSTPENELPSPRAIGLSGGGGLTTSQAKH